MVEKKREVFYFFFTKNRHVMMGIDMKIQLCKNVAALTLTAPYDIIKGKKLTFV